MTDLTMLGDDESDAQGAKPLALSAAQDSDALILLFVGKNRDLYRPFLEKMRAKDPAFRRVPLSWCWPGFFVPLVWLPYRKLYGFAAIVLFLPFAISFLVPSLGNSGTGLSMIVATFAKPIYLRYAAGRVEKLRKRATSDEELRILVEKAGGVSIPGAVVGTILTLCIVAGMIVSAFAIKL